MVQASSFFQIFEMDALLIMQDDVFIISNDDVNENPEVENTRLQNFEEKLYMNVGLDDKFGFDAETDWETVCLVLVEYPEKRPLS